MKNPVLTQKGAATTALARANARDGTSVHCWAEGGDATDDFEVPVHMAQEAQRVVDARMRSIEEYRARLAAQAATNG